MAEVDGCIGAHDNSMAPITYGITHEYYDYESMTDSECVVNTFFVRMGH